MDGPNTPAAALVEAEVETQDGQAFAPGEFRVPPDLRRPPIKHLAFDAEWYRFGLTFSPEWCE